MVELALPAAGVFVSGRVPDIITMSVADVPPFRTYYVESNPRIYVLPSSIRKYYVPLSSRKYPILPE
jgi:hypothetical protein